jgi:hypothetical protein
MNTRARAKAAQQMGLLTRGDALDAGMTPSLITAAIRAGDLVVVRRGVYALATCGPGSTSAAGIVPTRGRPRW